MADRWLEQIWEAMKFHGARPTKLVYNEETYKYEVQYTPFELLNADTSKPYAPGEQLTKTNLLIKTVNAKGQTLIIALHDYSEVKRERRLK